MSPELTIVARELIRAKMSAGDLKASKIYNVEGLEPGSVSRFLNGKTLMVSFETVARMMRFLGITMDEVFAKKTQLPKGNK